jgi:hypothetical protein
MTGVAHNLVIQRNLLNGKKVLYSDIQIHADIRCPTANISWSASLAVNDD